MKIIAIKDWRSGGYTAYHDLYPSVVIEVDEKEKIKTQLAKAFHDIIHGSEIEEHKFIKE